MCEYEGCFHPRQELKASKLQVYTAHGDEMSHTLEWKKNL